MIARFRKCALQVNPYTYLKQFRKQDQGLSEVDYNRELLKICLEEGIEVIGIANHGSVDGIDGIREAFKESGVLVLPGFEIMSTEKAHFVCLYSEKTSLQVLERYLGDLKLRDPEGGERPSQLSAVDIIRTVIKDQGGFIYAAHCTTANGVLLEKLPHIWVDPELRAAQIPGSVADLQATKFCSMVRNKEPAYQRERAMALINAADIAVPEDLRGKSSSCFIKMTKLSFDSLRQAFFDPESRVRLSSAVPPEPASAIESVAVIGGYLDGLKLGLSENLNAIIGGRGTGKSTLIECIRYALELDPIGKEAAKQHREIVQENLGRGRARIELVLRSARLGGRRFTIARRYGEAATVQDESGALSSFSPHDVLPGIEIYGQNEIYEISRDNQGLRSLVERFIRPDSAVERELAAVRAKLAENREAIVDAQDKLADIETEMLRLPKLREELELLRSRVGTEVLDRIPLLEREKVLRDRVGQELDTAMRALVAARDQFPDSGFLSEAAIGEMPHATILRKMRESLDVSIRALNESFAKAEAQVKSAQDSFTAEKGNLDSAIEADVAQIDRACEGLPSFEGQKGKAVGERYKAVTQDIERIKPKEGGYESRKAQIDELKKQRTLLLIDLSRLTSTASAAREGSLKSLNKKLAGRVRLKLNAEGDREGLKKYLLDLHLENVGEKRLTWVSDAEELSPRSLAGAIRRGAEALEGKHWAITPTVSAALCALDERDIMLLEELLLPDSLIMELNVGSGEAEVYRPLEKLSTGQQCTAILNLLLLDNVDPLIMDQPEDNLDNAFIADRIVAQIRDMKLERQFLFTTHNANIPVFGDAECIGVFHSEDDVGMIPLEDQGGIDVPEIAEKAASILEGGKAAFTLRREKYGYE